MPRGTATARERARPPALAEAGFEQIERGGARRPYTLHAATRAGSHHLAGR